MRLGFLTLLTILSSFCGLFAQGGATIEVLTTDVCVPNKVSMRVINCSSCVSFEWQIGSGTAFKAATDQYASIVTDTGWYDVAVRIKTSSGVVFLIGKKNAFYGRLSPKAKFTTSDTLFCNRSDTVFFKDITPNSVKRDWLIDGSVFYNAPVNMSYLFTGKTGYRSVYLSVQDSWGCKGNMFLDSAVGFFDSIKATPVLSKRTGCAPAYIDFSATLDTLLLSVKEMQWKFPGANPATKVGRNPKGIYYAKGDTFDLGLKVISHQGCSYSYSWNNIIFLGDTAILKISVPKNKLCISEAFTAKVTGNNTPFPVWKVLPAAAKLTTGIGPATLIKFLDTGKSNIIITETNNGCVSTAKYPSQVEVQGPKADFTVLDPYYCSTPTSLTFTNKSLPSPGTTTYSWSIAPNGGSSVSTGNSKNFSYTSNVAKSYDITLIATGSNGCADTAFVENGVSYGFINAGFTVEPAPVCPGGKVKLISIVGAGSPGKLNTFNWTFFDENDKPVKTSTVVEPEHVYNKIGKYNAKLVVSNTTGCKDSQLLVDTITVEAPVVNAFLKDTFVCVGEPLSVVVRGKGNNPNLLGLWQIKNVDSIVSPVFGTADSLVFSLYKTGKWQATYTLKDTSSGGCTTELVLPGYIRASGISYEVGYDKTYGCAPLKVNLTAKIRHNVSYEKSGPVKYLWKKYPNSNLYFSDSTQQNPVGTMQKGSQQLKLVYRNASGCADSTSYYTFNSGLNARYSLSEPARCVGKALQVYNQSSGWSTSVKYFTSDTDVVFLTPLTVKDPIVKFKSAGNHLIGIIANSPGCNDTWVNTISAFKVTADFFTPDSVVYCAPKLVKFYNTTNTTLLNYWKFGDGDSATTWFNETAGHLYVKNNTNPGYDIQLIAQDGNGCRDTLLRKGYLRVVGPIPDFTTTNTNGCEPLKVQFKNSSRDFNKMFLDYDNGVVLDSNKLGVYGYRVTDKSLMVQDFIPRLLLYDSFGCSALFVGKDTIRVKKSAEALHTFSSINFLRNTEGCANDLLVKFNNKSRFYSRIFWDFDNDGKVDLQNQNSPTYAYLKPGVFYPIIVAEHPNGCRDTFQRDSIVVWDPPVADWTSNTDSSCVINPVLFYNNTTSAYPIVKYDWNFGELPLYTDTSTSPNPVWKYSTPFNHAVNLAVIDAKGCQNQVSRNIYINDTAGPARPALAFITVRDNQWLDFYWQRSKLGNYMTYHVYLDSLGFWERYNSSNRSDTSFSAFYGNEPSNRRFCFSLTIEDTCHQNGKYAVSHCSMVLRDSAFEPFNIQLDWLSYDWWSTELSHYEVFRAPQGSTNFVKIADVKNTRQRYTDSFLCDSTYCYYIEAVHRNRIWRSRSNTVCKKPIYIKPESFVNTTLATVRTNDHSEVFWQPYYKYYRRFSFELQRSSSGTPGSFAKVIELGGTKYEDMAASVQDRINFYRVIFKDHCHQDSRPGSVSNTIWLQSASQNRNSTALTWNPYNYWHSGVKEYNLQLKDQAGVFQTIRTMGGSITKVDSINIELYQLDSICFRVFAVKDSSTFDTSWSNEVCLVPSSYVYVPTAFSPDDNRLNEVFKPVTAYIHQNSDDPNERYEFRVYNRWGQLVFETNDPKLGWDGRFGGELSQTGLYIWSVKALGFDGVPHRMNGTVYLMR